MKLLLVLAVAALVSGAQNAGLEVRIGSSLIEKAKDAGVLVLLNELKHLPIHNIVQNANIEIGTVKYTLSSITLRDLTMPKNTISPISPQEFKVQMAGVSAYVTFTWRYVQKAWPHVGDSGHGSVKVSSTMLTALLRTGEQGGHPLVVDDYTSVRIGGFDLSLAGGDSFLYKPFTTLFSSSLRSSVQGTLQTKIKDIFSTQLQRALASAPLAEPLAHGMAVDLSLVTAPRMEGKLFTTRHKGAFTPILPGSTATTPRAFGHEDDQQDVQFLISESVFHSAGAALVASGVLNTKIDSLPSSAPISLNTDSFEDVLPELYKKAPGTPITAQISAVEQPVVAVTPEGLHSLLSLDVAIALAPAGQDEEYCFTARALVNASGTAALTSGDKAHVTRLTGKSTSLHITLSLKDSAIGEMNVDGLQQLVDFVLDFVGRKKIEDVLAKGFALPAMPGAMLENASILHRDGYVVVSSDIRYSVRDLAAVISAQMK